MRVINKRFKMHNAKQRRTILQFNYSNNCLLFNASFIRPQKCKVLRIYYFYFLTFVHAFFYRANIISTFYTLVIYINIYLYQFAEDKLNNITRHSDITRLTLTMSNNRTYFIVTKFLRFKIIVQVNVSQQYNAKTAILPLKYNMFLLYAQYLWLILIAMIRATIVQTDIVKQHFSIPVIQFLYF